MLTPSSNVAILGFGKRAAAFAGLLAPRGCALRAWDPQLASADGSTQRALIEAAGVDAIPDLAVALRGARLVVLDTLPASALEAHGHVGQRVLDLASAPVAEIESILVALGLPPATTDWQAACAAAADLDTHHAPPPVRRGELP